MPDYKYLVFSGGGAPGVAYSGALEQLEKEAEFSFDKIEAVAGASAGALTALMVSLKYTPQEISQTLTSAKLKSLADGGILPEEGIHLATKYGMYKGDVLYKLILSSIEDKIKHIIPRIDPSTLTFADLKKFGFIDFHIVATKIREVNGIPTGKLKHFSYDTTPDTPVAGVLLASAAAPFYFERVRLKKVAKGKYILDDEGDLYCDGGLLNNLPINIFDKPKYVSGMNDDNITDIINPHTLALAVRPKAKIINSQHKPVKKRIGDDDPLKAFEGVFNSFLLDYEQEGLNKKKNAKRTIEIDTLGASTFNFNLDSDAIKALQESGKQAVIDFFHPQPIVTLNHFADKKVTNGSMWVAPNEPASESNNEKSQQYKCPCVLF